MDGIDQFSKIVEASAITVETPTIHQSQAADDDANAAMQALAKSLLLSAHSAHSAHSLVT